MIRSFLHALSTGSQPHGQHARRRRRRRLGLEGLEDRVLLSLNPTIYTVDLTSDTGAGSGNTGDIGYVINQANANPNPAGSLIEFSTPLFSTPQTITLTSTLGLWGVARADHDRRPGRRPADDQWQQRSPGVRSLPYDGCFLGPDHLVWPCLWWRRHYKLRRDVDQRLHDHEQQWQ